MCGMLVGGDGALGWCMGVPGVGGLFGMYVLHGESSKRLASPRNTKTGNTYNQPNMVCMCHDQVPGHTCMSGCGALVALG